MANNRDVMSYLTDLDYPADKWAIVNEAAREGAPEDISKALRALPLATYGSRDEIVRSVETADGELPAARRGAAARAPSRAQARTAQGERSQRR